MIINNTSASYNKFENHNNLLENSSALLRAASFLLIDVSRTTYNSLVITIKDSLLALRTMAMRIVNYLLSQNPPLSSQKPLSFIFRGTQDLCNGTVEESAAKAHLDILRQKAPKRITFNPQKILPQIEGGTCSAMSLEFLASYFQLKATANQTGEPLSLLPLGNLFTKSSPERRNLQAAYNSIEISKEASPDQEIEKDKVQALANFYSLSIQTAHPPIILSEHTFCQEELNGLPSGAFIVRITKPASNERGEKHGHTLIYIRQDGVNCLYDPNCGLIQLEAGREVAIVERVFQMNYRQFGVTHATFYLTTPSLQT